MATRRRDVNPTQQGATAAGGARKARKKPKASPSPRPTPSSTPKPRSGPIPTPYLALAPTPISSLSPSAIDQLASTSSLILPSSYVRSNSNRGQSRDVQVAQERTTTVSGVGPGAAVGVGAPGEAGPSRFGALRETSGEEGGAAVAAAGTGAGPTNGTRGTTSGTVRPKYVTNLLSPPAIIPGGTSSTPRIQAQPPANPRRRSGERERGGGPRTRRSEERLRDLVNVNASLTSLGQLGRILESDPTSNAGERERERGRPEEEEEQEAGLAQAREAVQQANRRRRRIVRGENGTGVVRRLTVSSREEGRAIGLARGASMRRTNVWDDIPEAGEPPPPFPFPTSSTNRLPPAFATSRPPMPSTEDRGADLGSTAMGRPRSPPPSFEMAVGLIPFIRPASAPAPAPPMTTTSTATTRTVTPPTPRPSRPALTLSTSEQTPAQMLIPESPGISPGSTHYASAPSSPTQTVIASTADLPVISSLSLPDSSQDAVRDDRREWNEDLLAGYTLEERVQREMERRRLREDRDMVRRASTDSSALSQTPLSASPQHASADIGSEVISDAASSDSGSTSAPSPKELDKTQSDDINRDAESTSIPSAQVGVASAPAEDQTASSRAAEGPQASPDTAQPEPSVSKSDTSASSLPSVDQETPSIDSHRHLAASGDRRASVADNTADTTTRISAPEVRQPPSVSASQSEKALPGLPVSPTESAGSSTGLASRSIIPEALRNLQPAQTPKGDLPAEATPSSQSVKPLRRPDVGSTTNNSAEPPAPPELTEATPLKQLQVKVSKPRSQPSRSASLDPTTSAEAASVDTKRLSVPNTDPTTTSSRLGVAEPGKTSKRPLFRGFSWGKSPELGSSPTLDPPLTIDNNQTMADRGDREPTVASSTEMQANLLPPNREAALRRRNLQSASPIPLPPTIATAPATKSKPMAAAKRSTPVSGPLINFDTPSPSPPSTPKRSLSQSRSVQLQERSPYQDISALAASSAELLALLEDGFIMDHEDGSDGKNGWNWSGDQSNQAESSAMGARRMEAIALASPPLASPPLPPPSSVRTEKSPLTLRRVPPPLTERDDSSKGKSSSIATSPRVGGHTRTDVENNGSPVRAALDSSDGPPKATRRPPPPPPRPRPVLSLRQPQVQPPPLPPRPGAERTSPDNARTVTPKRTTSASTASNSTIVPSPTKPIAEPVRRVSGGTQSTTNPTMTATTRPKGPRPPPPPPRKRLTSWFKSSAVAKDTQPPVVTSPASPAKRIIPPITPSIISEPTLVLRPLNARAQSEVPRSVLPLDTGEDDGTQMAADRDSLRGSERGVNRSASAFNLREQDSTLASSSLPSTSASQYGVRETSPGSLQDENLVIKTDIETGQNERERQTTADAVEGGSQEAESRNQTSRREWTDLDLLAARIEGSGREFEGFTQITSFLGPSKTPGATPAALSTLLPGLINVDSRRTTPQGRVKLKLSLLGLRVSKCPICLSQFKGGDKAVMLPMCSHVGHESCARRWFRESARCWVCREVLPEE
ncbi:hypothetical protein I317_06362 [Kwoniella heveanensis CBS 569]|nr:hypothetical protein I317_06362 [Kwoniella heveanensis CBS 569]